MEITVCIKQVPGTTQVDIDEETGVLKRNGITSKMNPYDLYAIETAMQIKQKTNAVVNAISMGPPQAESVLKEAFMMGAQSASLLTDRKFAGADVLATAYTLSQGIKKMGNPDIIICGKMTTDGDTAQVGPQIAEYLGIPHITNVCEIVEVNEHSLVVKVDTQATTETLSVLLPCLITVEKGIFQPRLPSFKLKLETENREVKQLTLNDLDDADETHYGLNGSPTKVKRIFPPKENDNYEIWDEDGKEIADKLYNKLCEMKFL